ncbi:MAG: hypothetical protein ABDH32_01375 [Candidatus Caldarchaeales archaeon]
MNRIIVIELPPYTEILGIPLTFYMFIGLVVGAVFLALAITILLIEYILWRGKKLGIYPPKK